MSGSFWAAGRVNLIGEHTDYGGGLVLPVAIDLGITLTWQPAEDIAIESDGAEPYVAAVVDELAALGRPPVGIAGRIESNLPPGAGLGSSGALEVVAALALCAAAQFELEPLELVLACQRAEHRATGVQTGILDQAASLLGRADHALLLDCGTLDHRWIELPEQLAILVVDSGERHEHATSGYAERRRELESGLPARVRHVRTENERVRATVAALERNDLDALAPLFAASHASLRDDYKVSTPALDRLVERALAAGALAARMTGGGFGGSVVVLARHERADALAAELGGLRVRPVDGALNRRRRDSPPGRA
jgi:galactokinase